MISRKDMIIVTRSRNCMRGSRSTAKLPMEFLVNTLLPFIEKYALLRIVVPYF